MKKLLTILSLLFCLCPYAFAGDGASGGGASSLWDSIFKTPNSMANPKYASEDSDEQGVVIYQDESDFKDIFLSTIHSFTTNDGAEIELKQIVAFIVKEESISKTFNELKISDINVILTADGYGYPVEILYRLQLH